MAARARVLIGGVVQGVSFRWYTQQQASMLGLTGWVRNLPDGRVEAVFEGSEDAVREMVAWCETGPRHASVDDVDVTWEDAEGLSSFDIA